METLLIVGIFTCLIGMFLQDWMHRKIHVLLPLGVFVLSLIVMKYPFSLKVSILLYNILFFSVVFSSLIAYMSIKNNTFLNPFEHYFGLGDLLFYVSVSPLFLLQGYVIFFIGSLIFALAVQIFFLKMLRKKTVPLAGYASLFLILIISSDIFLDLKKITLL